MGKWYDDKHKNALKEQYAVGLKMLREPNKIIQLVIKQR